MFVMYVATDFLTYLNIYSIVFLCTNTYIYFEKPLIQDGRVTLEVWCLIWLNYYLRKSSVTKTSSLLPNLDLTRVNLFLNFTFLRDTEANIYSFFNLDLRFFLIKKGCFFSIAVLTYQPQSAWQYFWFGVVFLLVMYTSAIYYKLNGLHIPCFFSESQIVFKGTSFLLYFNYMKSLNTIFLIRHIFQMFELDY